ncbi:hypothetical protein [Chitinophaga sp. CF418]|uniref:hypothetical protein n=1 Tax=Chitinophaga sp. CF418 TaxID=1855287 RepID=UPI00091F91AC|nr:hypothetical protein [Chitinophaga sp. CF418]SHN19919.1 hypothetical protein SAMN05216311_106321 [Chitinophaga sp. CF418]
MPSVRTLMYAACSVALFFTACSKEKNENPLSGLYVSANVVVYDSVKLYTKSGVITDTTIIRGALERRWDNVKFNLKAGTDSIEKYRTVNIDPERDSTYFDYKTYTRAYDIISHSNGLMVLLSKDSVTNLSIGAPFSPPGTVLDCGSSGALITKYRNSYAYGSAGVDSFYRKGKRHAILEESAGYLTYPGITYLFTRHSNGRSVCIASSPDINNQFNEGVLAMLGNEDTLIVQISRLRLIKQ